jgi:putative ABC transport system permease protein
VRDWRAFVRARLSLPELTPERESRIVREIAAQLEDFYREAVAQGATDEEADAHARAQIRDWPRMARDVRAADRRHTRPRIERLTTSLEQIAQPKRGALRMLANMLTDMRYAVRQMLKTPGFTIVAILTLAFGIGATSAIFSVVNGVMLRPLPFPQPDRLVMVFEVLPQYGRFSVAPANFFDWRQQNGVFERIAAFSGGTETFIGSDGPERVSMASVSWDLFEALGVSPAHGRGFRPEEDLPKQNNVIVLSHGMWQRRFGGDPAVLGRTITLSGAPVTITGVMPAGFYFPNRTAEFWRPIAFNPSSATRGGHFLGVVARLKPGVSLEQAGAEMRGIAGRLAQQHPDTNRNESAEMLRMHDLIVGPIRPMLLTLLAAVGLVILIACANVANLLLVRASVREKEIAIRAAMGAGRGRLVMQMLAESLVLALAGGALGLLLAWLAIGPIQTLSAGSIPRVADISLDRTVLLFAFLVTMATGIVFGLAPAWQASRGAVGAALKEGGRSSATSRGRRLRSALLVAEVALSIVLLVGATLLLRSFAKLTNVEPGFDPAHVLAFRVALPQTSYPGPHQRAAFFDRLLEALHTTPGIEAAGMVQQLPMRGDYVLSFTIDRRPVTRGEEPSANYRAVSPRYFAALRIPVLRGRAFTEQDVEKAPMVAVIDEAFAKRHFPGEDPMGRGIDIGNGTDGFFKIVGVVADVHHEGLHAEPNPTMYVPFRQDVFGSMWLMARTSGDPAQFAGAARQAVAQLDPAIPAFSITPLEEVITESVAQRRFSMLLVAVFALVALFLAAVGLYGVVGYTVSQRTQEIGLRMAIGAQAGDVLRMVLGGGMKLAIVGVVIGIAGALGLARLVASMLFEVTPFDPASYAATAAVLLAVSALACYVPARRAMSVDPLVALRQE